MAAANPRRLAILGPFPPVRGGIAHFDQQVADALEDRGHTVVRVPFRRLYPGILFPGRSQYEPGSGPDREAKLTATNVWSWRRVARDLATSDVDAVVAAYWTPLLAPAIGTVIRRSGRPVVGLVHNAVPHESIPGARALAGWMLGGCDAVLTLSDGVAKDVRSMGFKGPISTTPHPVYDRFPDALPRADARDRLGIGADVTVLLFFGLVRAYKGLDVLVEALPSIRDRLGKVRLIVAGEWYEKPEPIRSRIRALGLADEVMIEDTYVPDDRVAHLFSAADLAVLPYRGGTQSGVLETAARYGVPMVVSDVPGLADAVVRYGAGTVARRDDAASLVTAVVEAAGNRDRLAAGARSMAESHGWGPFCDALELLLDLARTGHGAGSQRRTEVTGSAREVD